MKHKMKISKVLAASAGTGSATVASIAAVMTAAGTAVAAKKRT